MALGSCDCTDWQRAHGLHVVWHPRQVSICLVLLTEQWRFVHQEVTWFHVLYFIKWHTFPHALYTFIAESENLHYFTSHLFLLPRWPLISPAGVCAIISVEVMRQSVKRMIESEETIWIEYYYSWSFACACTAFVFLFLSGITLLILSMPQMPKNPWETCMDAEPDQIE